jgi:hypothetical protein
MNEKMNAKRLSLKKTTIVNCDPFIPRGLKEFRVRSETQISLPTQIPIFCIP